VEPVVVPTFKEWLDDAPYNTERKESLEVTESSLAGAPPSKRDRSKIKSFVKLESYPTWKEARWINSRSDAFKVYSGPAFKAIENQLYQNPWFIKHVPVPDRPALVVGLEHAGLRYYENDFKAFESHFTPELMNACECRLYKHCLVNYPELAKVICDTLTGVNRLSTRRGVRAVVKGRRMSGDMCTSLGNGFTNLMLILFIAKQKGGTARGFVEGDDGLFAVDFQLSALDYAKLGFEVEIKEVPTPSHGHFCGMTMTSSLEVIKDPRRVLQQFGWTSSYIGAGNRIMDELLRSKSLSLCYELPQCPIVGVLARTALSLTEGIAIAHTTSSYRECPTNFTGPTGPFAPSDEARLLTAELFKIPIEVQLAVEAAIKEHDMELVSQLLPPSLESAAYYDRYIELG